MNQVEALKAAKDMLPEIADELRLVRTHAIGTEFAHDDEFHIWSHINGGCEILAHSIHSWEHALSLVKAERISLVKAERIANYDPADHSDIDAEIENAKLGTF